MSERGDNANKRFTCSYEFDGGRWSVDVWASTFEEAEMKLRAMGRGTVDGVVKSIFRADDAQEAVEFLQSGMGKCPTCGRELE